MFENPRRGRQARNFTTSVSKILDLKSSSEQIFFRKLSLGAPAFWKQVTLVILTLLYLTPFYFCKQSDRLTEVKTIKSALWDLRKGERVRFYGGKVYSQ